MSEALHVLKHLDECLCWLEVEIKLWALRCYVPKHYIRHMKLTM